MIENTDFTPPPDPWTLFREWFELAQKKEPNDANAMSLATATEEGLPSVRIVLLKDIESGGFTFYTNRQSHKGEQLAQRAVELRRVGNRRDAERRRQNRHDGGCDGVHARSASSGRNS